MWLWYAHTIEIKTISQTDFHQYFFFYVTRPFSFHSTFRILCIRLGPIRLIQAPGYLNAYMPRYPFFILNGILTQTNTFQFPFHFQSTLNSSTSNIRYLIICYNFFSFFVVFFNTVPIANCQLDMCGDLYEYSNFGWYVYISYGN